MSEYKFKNLSEINTVAEPAEGTTMMGFENGTPDSDADERGQRFWWCVYY